MIDLQPILVSGLVLGSLYALMATGLSLVWSTLGIFNFSHGVLMMLGAYVAWTLGDQAGLGLGFAAGTALSVVVLIGVGGLIEWTLVHPFLARKDTVLIAVITTLAASILLENGALLTWGPRLKQLPPVVEGNARLFGVAISAHELVIIFAAPLILAALWAFLKFTRLGSAIRAVAQNRESALLLGINVPLLYMTAFGFAAGLAALAGILLGAIRFLVPTMGAEPLTKALIVAIFGGLGSIGGTIGGAYVIGLIEAASNRLIGFFWTPAILFTLLILVLIFRPTGLFGRK